MAAFTFLSFTLYGCQTLLAAPISAHLLGTGRREVGWIEAAAGVGGVLAAIAMSRHPRARRDHRALPVAVVARPHRPHIVCRFELLVAE